MWFPHKLFFQKGLFIAKTPRRPRTIFYIGEKNANVKSLNTQQNSTDRSAQVFHKIGFRRFYEKKRSLASFSNQQPT
jgi:hypothetical protein